MNREQRERLYLDALSLWGEAAQLGMLQEECAEVIVAVSKWNRGERGSSGRLAGEMADAFIMLEQIQLALGLEDEVDDYINRKLERLKVRIKTAKLKMLDKKPEELDA